MGLGLIKSKFRVLLAPERLEIVTLVGHDRHNVRQRPSPNRSRVLPLSPSPSLKNQKQKNKKTNRIFRIDSRAMIGENPQLVTDEPVEFEK